MRILASAAAELFQARSDHNRRLFVIRPRRVGSGEVVVRVPPKSVDVRQDTYALSVQVDERYQPARLRSPPDAVGADMRLSEDQ